MNARVVWKNGLTFSGTAETGFQVPLGADPGVGGANDGFRPMELLCVSLAGCTAMDVISILQKKRQEVSGFEVRVVADKATEHPKVLTDTILEYVVWGRGIEEAAVRRAIGLSAERYCPVQAMLSKAVPIHLRYRIYEGDPTTGSAPVMEGEWRPE